ncbi:NDR1/HIN1-like protein 12 [Cornus florida]|uniref:NDR1/HIN1-like protein 12 n=1 Tax=Cornus florida TaxID=4283 RepID=UPI0028997B09|nr:NDR1/HIN1-like protein 12 [Cornus florida]
MATRKHAIGFNRRTNPIVWLVVIICTILAVAVTITGLVVFVGYEVIKPRVPSIGVIYANLDKFDYSQAGQLTTMVTIVLRFENHNVKAHATFYDASFILGFHGTEVASLAADQFDVSKNSSVDYKYPVESTPVPLGPGEQEYVESSMKQGTIIFELKGNARTRWRIAPIGSVKFGLHLNCELHFSTKNGTYTSKYCRSKV